MNDNAPTRGRESRARPSGFTLAELLVVVAILSAVAMASFSLVTEDRAQARADDTRSRILALRRAILGPETPAYGGELRLAGYVADNGQLPENLRALIDAAGHMRRGGVTPPLSAISPSSGSSGCFLKMPEEEDAAEGETAEGSVSSDAAKAARVVKGHRGDYLAGLTHNGKFRDGWGNVQLNGDEDNFGWMWTRTRTWTMDSSQEPLDLKITSLGTDNQPGSNTSGVGTEDEEGADDGTETDDETETGGEAETGGETGGAGAVDEPDPTMIVAGADQSMSIAEADWLVPLDGWRVTLKNAKVANASSSGALDSSSEGSDSDSESSGDEDAGAGHLKPGEFGDSSISTFDDIDFVLLVFKNGDGVGRWRQYWSNWNSCKGKSVLEPGEACVFGFDAGSDGKIACGEGGASVDARVPLGRHVLALTTKHKWPSASAKRRIVTQVDFFPGALQPNLVLELR